MNRSIIETKRKWWLISLSFIICHLSFSPAGAQTTFTQRIQQDKKTGGRLTVTHSHDIDVLVNGRSSASQPVHQNEQVAKNQAKPVASTQPEKQEKEESKTAATTIRRTEPILSDTAIIIPPTEPKKKVMLGSYKVTGYRVQAFAGGNQRKDRVKAEQTAADIKAHFPDEPVYTHFYSPRWICRVGNYRTYEKAQEMLIAIRKLGYTSAVIVKGKITVQRTE